jgi:CheY-like chemotaxis protein
LPSPSPLTKRFGNQKASVFVVAMTALAQEKDKQACFDAGMNDYQSKPFSMDMLADCLKKWTTSDRQKKIPTPGKTVTSAKHTTSV